MAKRILLTLAALFSAAILFAQTGGVKGTVINRNGRQGIENARLVLLKDASTIGTALSDKDGEFIFRHLPDGMYTLVVDAPDFLEAQVELAVVDGQVKNLFNIGLVSIQHITELDDDSFTLSREDC